MFHLTPIMNFWVLDCMECGEFRQVVEFLKGTGRTFEAPRPGNNWARATGTRWDSKMIHVLFLSRLRTNRRITFLMDNISTMT